MPSDWPWSRPPAEEAGRPVPWLSARVRVEFEPATSGYAMRSTPEEIAAEVRRFAALGVTHLGLYFGATDPGEVVTLAERFDREVAPIV
jgi:hypothetical protein